MTIIVLAGIATIVAAAASLLLVQSASATTDDVMTTTASVEEGKQAAASGTTTATNNVSNAVLGSLFLTGQDRLTSFNRVNETYTEVSYAGNKQ